MPVSQGSVSSGPFGLQLRGWALVDGATGALVSSSGVASSLRSVAGSYQITLSSATSLQAVVVARGSNSNNSPGTNARGGMETTTQARVWTEVGGALTDCGSVHVEVWA